MAIYKRDRGFELLTTENKSCKWPERDSNPGPPDCESDALTTRPRCLPKKQVSPDRMRSVKEALNGYQRFPSLTVVSHSPINIDERRIPISALKHTYQLRARYAQHLKHTQNHITRAVAAMDSCCAHGCHCSNDMVLRMLKVLGIPSAELVGVLHCCSWYCYREELSMEAREPLSLLSVMLFTRSRSVPRVRSKIETTEKV